MLIVGVLAFFAAELLYGSRGPDSGALQFILYGLVGFVPATISSWLAHEAARQAGAGISLSNPDASMRRDAVTQLAPTFRVAM